MFSTMLLLQTVQREDLCKFANRGFAVIELSSRLMPLAMNYAMSWEVIQQTTVFLAIRNFNPTRTSL